MGLLLAFVHTTICTITDLVLTSYLLVLQIDTFTTCTWNYLLKVGRHMYIYRGFFGWEYVFYLKKFRL